MAQTQDYYWLTRYARDDYGVYTFVRSKRVDSILEVFGCRREELEPIDLRETIWDGSPGAYVSLLTIDDSEWTAISEHGSRFNGMTHLADLSRFGFAMYCSFASSNPLVGFARDGVLIREFDAVSYLPEGALPEEAGLPFATDEAIPAVAVLVEGITGLQIQESWLIGDMEAAVWVDS